MGATFPMTTRRVAILTLWAFAFLALAAAIGMQTRATASDAAVATFDDVAIDPLDEAMLETEPSPTPVPTPEPTPMVEPTPVEPPAWIEIPANLVATPTPDSPTVVPLPMLTNIVSAPRDARAVYLTFDDGPDPIHTNQILDLLARYNAKATFFVLGNNVDAYPGVVQRMVAEGHAVGNHTYYHEALPRHTAEEVIQTLSATNNAIARATGRTTSCMRPPYGSLDQTTYELVQSQGYRVSMWEVDSDDWKLSDGYTIAAGILRDTNLGNRVLMHDGPSNRAPTVAALESVLQVLSNRGVQFQALQC